MAASGAATADRQTLKPAWDGLWGEDEDGPYLVGGRCGSCGGAALGVREICPHCHAQGAMRAEPIGRRGRLYTATVIHQAPPGFAAPYRVGYVDLDDGVRIFAHVAQGEGAPRLGDEVALAIAPVKTGPDGAPLGGPLYRRARGGGAA